MKAFLNRAPYQLSIGEKRRVTLAAILAYEPDLLLLDEPTANLSYKSTMEVEEAIVEARDQGKAVVVASHDVEFIAQTADRIYVLNRGETFGGGNTRAMLTDEEMLRLADMRLPLVFETVRRLGLKFREPP